MRITAQDSSFFRCLIGFHGYKPNQGRLVRRVTLLVGLVVVAVLSQRMYLILNPASGTNTALMCSGTTFLLGLWICSRVVQYAPFVEFLIDVQLESTKVTWNTWEELRQTTVVVLVVMLTLSVYLFMCDIIWQTVLRAMSILNLQ
jgi:preprotein translocase SecE subunit